MKKVKLIKVHTDSISNFCPKGKSYIDENGLKSMYYYRNEYYYLSAKELINLVKDFADKKDGKYYISPIAGITNTPAFPVHLKSVIADIYGKSPISEKQMKTATTREITQIAMKFLSKKEKEYYQLDSNLMGDTNMGICTRGQNVTSLYKNGINVVYFTEEDFKQAILDYFKLGDEAGISGYSFSYNVSYFLMSVVYRYELGRDKKLLKFFRGTMDATMIHRYLISGYFNKVIGKRSIENTLYKRGINKALNIYVDIFNEIYKRIPSK